MSPQHPILRQLTTTEKKQQAIFRKQISIIKQQKINNELIKLLKKEKYNIRVLIFVGSCAIGIGIPSTILSGGILGPGCIGFGCICISTGACSIKKNKKSLKYAIKSVLKLKIARQKIVNQLLQST